MFIKPFEAPLAKIRRAQKHVGDLNNITIAHLASKPVTFTVNADVKPPDILSMSFEYRGPGEEYSLVFGDAVHCLRTALDLLATDIVRARNGNPKGVYFPFAESAGELDYQIKQKKFLRAGDDAVALLKKFAPYRGGNAALRAIHDLDVQDKHQFMLPSFMTFASPVMRVDQDESGAVKLVPIGDNTGASEIVLTFPADSSLAGQTVIPALEELVQLTTGIVEAFKALCEIPGVVVDPATHAEPAELTASLVTEDGEVLPLGSVVQRSSS